MDLTLVRDEFRDDGIFGKLLRSDTGEQLAVTLEHAYDAARGDGSYAPKLVPGQYVCKRHPPVKFPYETFEIMDVPGHTAILFHIGNYNKDSDGCVLVGKYKNEIGGAQMIGLSRVTFVHLMEIMTDVDQFNLTVKDA